MKRTGWRISIYILRAIFPYFIFAWLLLSVILFVQQAGRFSDIFFSVNIPSTLIWQLTFALVPNVIAFTCPMAILVGVIIGLTKMQTDSELVALRSAGIGNFQIALPILFLGAALSIFTFLVNVFGVPLAATVVRQTALQTALYKLESPLEPGVFNTEINNFTIYVKDFDFENKKWKNIFIFNEDENQLRLITSQSGRIDTKDDTSELVLENAAINTFSNDKKQPKFISENVGELRTAIKTKRGELIEKLSNSQDTPEELGFRDLSNLAENATGREKVEAQILWQRRLILIATPLIFALLGVALVTRFNRAGRGFGIFLALVSLIGYYLLTLLGEQLARTNFLPVQIGGLLPIAASLLLIAWFFVRQRYFPAKSGGDFQQGIREKILRSALFSKNKRSGWQFSRRILDFDIIINLLKYFALTLVFLTAIYMLFTAFELWKFAGEINGGVWLLAKYLFYLIPFIYIQLAPSALMIATLATFVIKSRQNEIVTWISAGQSIYRLLLPCFGLMLLIGGLNFALQETILPQTNQMQDNFRAQIRSRGIMANRKGKNWIVSQNRIYSFEIDDAKNSPTHAVKNLSVYEFSADNAKLEAIYKTAKGIWEKDKIVFLESTERKTNDNGKVKESILEDFSLPENSNPFDNLAEKPNHLTIRQIKERIAETESPTERKNYQVALEKRYTTLILPFVITLFTAPFALSLSRKGKVLTIGYAVAIWLIFIAVSSTFEQYGLNDSLTVQVAVRSPLILFSVIGIFLLSRIKT